MKLILRAPVPRWVGRLIDEGRDFRDHRNSWLTDAWLDSYGTRPSFWRRVALTADLLLLRYWMPVMCLVVGHDLVDEDPGNPENGPKPCVYCKRCEHR